MPFPASYDDCTEIAVVTSVTDVVDYDRIQTMITAGNQMVCDCSVASEGRISDKLDIVESGIRQVISNVVDEVNENQSIIETSTGRIFKVIV